MERIISVKDADEILDFTWLSLYAYCGPTQIIASALIFRLFERAFSDLSPETPPDREDIRFLSGFPGTGIAECVELVTRLQSRHPDRFSVRPEAAPPDAPLSVSGSLYFEVQIGAQRQAYWPPGHIFDDTFRNKIQLFQNGGGTPKEREAYFLYKKNLAQVLLISPLESLFTTRRVTNLAHQEHP